MLIDNHVVIGFLGGVCVMMIAYWLSRLYMRWEILLRIPERIKQAERKVNAEPQKIKPAWDLQQVLFEQYISRNLDHITAIFWLCVGVMVVGFFIILWGIILAFNSPEKNLLVIVTGGAGV